VLHLSGEGEAIDIGEVMEDEVTVTTTDTLQQVVRNSVGSFSWKVRAAGTEPWHSLGETSNPFWVTWRAPGCAVVGADTAKRVNWVTENANGTACEDESALAIWDALCDDPPYEKGEGLTLPDSMWDLLDGWPFFGDCRHQAELMRLAMIALGVPAGYGVVYGSTSDGNCRDPEWRDDCPHGHPLEWLIINHDGIYHGFAACCVTGGWWYCTVPELWGPSEWHLLWEVAGPPNYQRWCETRDDLPPDPYAEEPVVIRSECDIEPTPQPGE
jgi:hypothetical protein